MTNKGNNLKALRDSMVFAMKEDRGQTPAHTIKGWIEKLDDIMQLPEFDPNQLHLFAPAPGARTFDPAASHAAAQEVERKYNLSEMRRNICVLLHKLGPMVDPVLRTEYMIEFGGNFAESTIRKRRNECVVMGWIHNPYGKTEEHHGTKYTLWAITGSGISALGMEE